jgi:hypothetical protein
MTVTCFCEPTTAVPSGSYFVWSEIFPPDADQPVRGKRPVQLNHRAVFRAEKTRLGDRGSFVAEADKVIGDLADYRRRIDLDAYRLCGLCERR